MGRIRRSSYTVGKREFGAYVGKSPYRQLTQQEPTRRSLWPRIQSREALGVHELIRRRLLHLWKQFGSQADDRVVFFCKPPGANPGAWPAGHACKSSILKALQHAKRLAACDCSRFCSCQILKVQRSSTSGGEPGIQNTRLTKRSSGREPGPEPVLTTC